MQATEAEQFDPATREPVYGRSRLCKARHRRRRRSAKRQHARPFAGQQSDGLRDVVATLAAHTRWSLSPAIIEDEKNPEIDFAALGETPTTLFYGVPHRW